MKRWVDDVLAEYVADARRAGHGWDAIATSLGVTRQAAWQRFHTGSTPCHENGFLRADEIWSILTGRTSRALARPRGPVRDGRVQRDSHVHGPRARRAELELAPPAAQRPQCAPAQEESGRPRVGRPRQLPPSLIADWLRPTPRRGPPMPPHRDREGARSTNKFPC